MPQSSLGHEARQFALFVLDCPAQMHNLHISGGSARPFFMKFLKNWTKKYDGSRPAFKVGQSRHLCQISNRHADAN
jgi:hypothetical protein